MPYLSPDKGGPPGQTRIGNLRFLNRGPHRVTTHAPGWRHHQPEPGVHYWRTPSGYWFRVDHQGSHALGRHAALPWAISEPGLPSTDGRLDRDMCWPLRDRSPAEGVLIELLAG